MPDARRTHRVLAALFLFGSLGASAELVLLGHTENAWQNIPLVLIAAGCLSLVVLLVRPGRTQVKAFQAVLASFVMAGITGVWLHYRSNMEFEVEMNPDAGGTELFWESMKGATPALAPGAMILLGGVGFVCAALSPRK